MPKIPTYTAQGRPTAEVGSLRSNIKLDPTRTMASGLLPAANAIDNYYLKQRDNNEKLEARKTFYEMKAESDKVIEKYKNNPDEFNSVNSYNNDFGNYRKQKLSQIKNGRVKKKLELLLDEDQAENVYKIKNNSFDAFETNANQTYNDGQNILANEYALAGDEKTKEIKLKNQINLAKEHGDMFLMGEAWLKEETNKIKANAELFEVDSALAKKDFATATNILKQSKSIDNDDVEKRIIKIKEQEGEYNELNYYVGGFFEGKNLMIGADFKFVDEKKIIAETEKRLFNQAAKNNLDEVNTFRVVDDVFSKTGLLSPTLQETIEAGFTSGSATTFDSPTDIPDVLIQAVKTAEAADQLGRLNLYTTDEQEIFFQNIIVSKKILGLNDFDAIKNAKNIQMNYDKAVFTGASTARNRTLTLIETNFKKTNATNIGEVKGYANKLFNMYVASNINPKIAQKRVISDLDKNLQIIDGYAYMKRNIDSFKSIGGLDQVKPMKEYIIKNKMTDEDPDDFYLRYNDGGIFEIRSRLDESTVYDKDNNPMIYYAKNLFAFNQERQSEGRSIIKKETIESQERKIKAKEEFETSGFNITGS